MAGITLSELLKKMIEMGAATSIFRPTVHRVSACTESCARWTCRL